MSRIFTDAELAKMGRKTLDVLKESIETGDKERSLRLATRMHREFRAMHDLYCNWVTALLSYIGRTYGEEAFAAAQREGVAVWLKTVTFKALEGKDFADQVRTFVAGIRGHGENAIVEEDDEKVIIHEPCASGGRVCKGETGYKDFHKLKKPVPMTFGREDFPAYCTLCSIIPQLSIEWYGYPIFACDPAEKLGEVPCRQLMYKDKSQIPDKVYERIGKKKPAKEAKNNK